MSSETIVNICMIVIITLLVIYIWNNQSEHYANKDEKANTIVEWFSKQNEPSYSNYQTAVPKSDIVEYSEAKKLYQGGKLSTGNLTSVL